MLNVVKGTTLYWWNCSFVFLVAVTVKKIFDKYLLEINKELSYVHFELKACRDQYDGQVCYGVVNNVSDDQSKLGTKYSVPQIAFFKGIVSHSLGLFFSLAFLLLLIKYLKFYSFVRVIIIWISLFFATSLYNI